MMSIGFFLDDNQPVMWRGPMLHRALEQFLSDVHWGELDTLVVDMSGETFGTGGGESLAEELGVPLLGSVPLDSRLREAGDAGEPLVESDPGSEPARAIAAIAEAISATKREQ